MEREPEYPHAQAAFINAIREEGTKQEACTWLQRTWNERCALAAQVRVLEKENAELKSQLLDARDYPV